MCIRDSAQGEHKIQRGYLPTPTFSAHWIAHPGLRRAIGEFLEEERVGKLGEMEALMAFSPYRRADEEG